MPRNIDTRVRIEFDLNGTIENEVTGGYNPDRLELRALSPVLDPRIRKHRNVSADVCDYQIYLLT